MNTANRARILRPPSGERPSRGHAHEDTLDTFGGHSAFGTCLCGCMRDHWDSASYWRCGSACCERRQDCWLTLYPTSNSTAGYHRQCHWRASIPGQPGTDRRTPQALGDARIAWRGDLRSLLDAFYPAKGREFAHVHATISRETALLSALATARGQDRKPHIALRIPRQATSFQPSHKSVTGVQS